MIIGNREFDTVNGCYVMGILNVTPDSFSDGGKWKRLDRALEHAQQMVLEGADIIDIGGESTRPGYTVISDEEEISRIVPVIEAVKRELEVPVSVDTYKGNVAEAALSVGADLVNDIWGFKHDDKIARVTAEYDAACCLMHNRHDTDYGDFVQDVINDLAKSVELALAAGVKQDKIILDPGVGFAKDLQQNLTITNHVDELLKAGYPVLLGTSRKSMIGLTLDLPSDQRVEGTVATSVIGYMRGCSFFRVHDVKENRRALDMTKAILGK